MDDINYGLSHMIIYIIYHNPYLSIIYFYRKILLKSDGKQFIRYQPVIGQSSSTGRCRSLEVKDFSNEGGWVYQLDGEKFYQ
jgi:hypothetical protein